MPAFLCLRKLPRRQHWVWTAAQVRTRCSAIFCCERFSASSALAERTVHHVGWHEFIMWLLVCPMIAVGAELGMPAGAIRQ